MRSKSKKHEQDIFGYLSEHHAGNFLINEPLDRHTWYGIGGPASYFVFPQSRDLLVRLLQKCKEWQIAQFVIGEGANLLVNDRGFDGMVISLAGFRSIARNDTTVQAGAGCTLRNLVLFCERNGLSGVQFLSGIPGTVGGALTMNAGIDQGAIGDCVSEVTFIDANAGVGRLSRQQIAFGYRSAPELQDKVLLGCTLKMKPQDESVLRETRIEMLKKRAAKQPLEFGSCGSVFKRPAGHYVGRMVEDAGLKGVRRGDAMVSEKHGGFIVNLGGARAEDVMYLIELVRDEVYKRYSVQLEPEVRFLGF